MIRVILPQHLRTLAHVTGEVTRWISQVRRQRVPVLDALEAQYPMLQGTIRDHTPPRALVHSYDSLLADDLS
jgi:hypothetical protein